MKKNKVILIEDDVQLAECFRLIINNSQQYEIEGCYTNFNDAKANVMRIFPDIVLMDIQLPGINGIEATRKIKSEFPSVKVIILSVHNDEEHILKAIKAGADGYLSKDSSYSEIIEALDTTINGGAAISSDVAKKLVDSFHLNRNSPLSNREAEVLQHFADGYSYVRIAKILFLSKETIKTHMRNIYSKLGVCNKNEAIELAREKKYIL